MPSTDQPLTFFSALVVGLSRVLAWIDLGVHYTGNYILYIFLGGFKTQTHTRPQRLKGGRVYSPSVVVTGATEGIGLATALHPSNKDYTGRIHLVVMDVLSPESIVACLEQINLQVSSTTDNPFIGVLDFWAYISVIRAFLPTTKQNKGRFINVGSFGGYANPPLRAPYCALKAAVESMTKPWRLEMMPFGVGMTTIRPGWTCTGGIKPQIIGAWDRYFDNIPKGAVGVDSFGIVIQTDMAEGDAEEKICRPMVGKWHKLTILAAEGIAQSSEAVVAIIHDALADKFLQPYCTVGYDTLLGQMARDLTPENIYQYSVAKSFGCL
ncbi:hypothetical protein QBC36DRAFT_372962 [Triangularia setosa]|uniref:NAD(P)-binding protein n=1 Tax=Triangularia setosa TaxID=2587417 RepID=A0AAN7A8B5_9PEZI|nr:hypothetical protein QBC36DRAFT_372962 [Podospora setosa]